MSDTKLNDYPKFGVWPDGYYMSINQFTCNILTCNWAGAAAVVFEREKMLAGAPARMIYFDLLSVDPNLGGMLPSDLDGAAPPAGTPNVFAQVDDDAWGYSPDQLQLWAFNTTWGTSPTATFTLLQTLGTAAFDSNMCGFARNCIPQNGTGVRIDALSDRLMFRLQFRNFGSRHTLITSHTVDATGADRAGIRWYELNDSGSGWSITQQATYSPDATHRWMSSVAMNGAGHLSLGFSASSGTLFPSIRATGRLPGDAAGLMTQGETTLVAGGGSQSHSSGRWGDYSMMAVDPVDDCTFWYTQEYYSANSLASWKTRVSSFKLADCGGGGGGNTAPTVNIVSPAPGANVAGTVTIEIAALDVEDAAGTLNVQWNIDGGAFQTTTYNAGTGYYEATWNTTTTGNGGHTINARATDTGGASANAVTSATVNNPGATTHVGDLDSSTTAKGNTWTALITITVHDANHAPLAGATVSGSWSLGSAGSSCTTGSNGQCTVSRSGISKRAVSVTFIVNDVTAPSKTYASSLNHDPDGDSNGTSVTVSR